MFDNEEYREYEYYNSYDKGEDEINYQDYEGDNFNNGSQNSVASLIITYMVGIFLGKVLYYVVKYAFYGIRFVFRLFVGLLILIKDAIIRFWKVLRNKPLED